ncbi:MAG: HIT domain-containing protein [Phycisphaerae bacterium]
MAEFQENLWAPWRMQYISGLREDAADGCFLCQYHAAPARDAEQLVVWRTANVLVLLNRFPYSSGHLLVAPTAHVSEPEMLSDEVLCELSRQTRDAKRVVQAALGAQGFNIGMNLGRCAGAGLPEHMHWHIVPRWSGDTNVMSVVGAVRVIPDSLENIHAKLRTTAAALGVGQR